MRHSPVALGADSDVRHTRRHAAGRSDEGRELLLLPRRARPHRIVASRGDTASEDFGQAGLHAEAGHRYWLHLDFDGDFGTQLEWVDEDKARPMIERCDYKELVDAPDGEEAPRACRTRALSPRRA